MALTATTLAGAKATNDVFISLTSATGILPKNLALVDTEWMRVTSNLLTPTIGVVPGYSGSPAGPHGILAPVIYGPTQDFVAVGIFPGSIMPSQSFGVDGAITGPSGTGVPTANTVIYLTKATAGAYTLAGPAKDQQNTVIFVSTTAAAHVITYTAGFFGNTTSSDTATFPATINGVFTMKAQNGTWAPVTAGTMTSVVVA
jgi:hypothetical protein